MIGHMIYGVGLGPRIADRVNALVWWSRGVHRYGWHYLVRQSWLP